MATGIRGEIVAQIPFLKLFAVRLTRDRALADDVLQNTLVRALTHADRFQIGTNLRAWLSTILRNCYLNEVRSRSRSIFHPFNDALSPPVSGGQEERIMFKEFCGSFGRLSSKQQEALLMVGMEGAPYDEAAERSGCAVGTIKSRVCRGREQLAKFAST